MPFAGCSLFPLSRSAAAPRALTPCRLPPSSLKHHLSLCYPAPAENSPGQSGAGPDLHQSTTFFIYPTTKQHHHQTNITFHQIHQSTNLFFVPNILQKMCQHVLFSFFLLNYVSNHQFNKFVLNIFFSYNSPNTVLSIVLSVMIWK